MEPVTQYFKEEKKESIFFILIGLLSVLLSLYFLFVRQEAFFDGISYATIAIGLIQLVVGTTILLRSDIDIVRVNHYIEREEKSVRDYEIPRMEQVIKYFVIYRWVEITLIIIGFFLYLTFDTKTMGKGLGLGLVIQSSIMLFLDFLAEKRGKEYISFLTSLDQMKITLDSK
jgi:hypothetical protein